VRIAIQLRRIASAEPTPDHTFTLTHACRRRQRLIQNYIGEVSAGQTPGGVAGMERLFYVDGMAEHVEHWFNRRYKMNRRDVYLIRTETGWQVKGREGGSDGREVVHYFDAEQDARAMLRRMLDAVAPGLSNRAQMTGRNDRRR
jgi:hypothetical protein